MKNTIYTHTDTHTIVPVSSELYGSYPLVSPSFERDPFFPPSLGRSPAMEETEFLTHHPTPHSRVIIT